MAGAPETFEDMRLEILTHDFYEKIKASGRFCWLGLVKGVDTLQRPRLDIYLVERPKGSISGAPLSETIDDLALALRPHTLMNIYFLEGVPASEAQERVEQIIQQDENPGKLIFHEAIEN